MNKKPIAEKYDLICVGGGIMSATLALMLKLIDSSVKIAIFERLDKVAQESSEAWNNSGTGHSAFCELNYTPEKEDGGIDISKAIQIFDQFEKSKQFWAYLVEQNLVKNPKQFIHKAPHHSWVTGKDNVEFLKKRFEKMSKEFAFREMEFSEDYSTLIEWFPLIMKNRDHSSEPMAATRMELGTEVNFGNITEQFFSILEEKFDTPVFRNHDVLDVDPDQEDWLVEVKDLKNEQKKYYDADHVFIGAGGGALPLLQKVEIEEKKGYGGFPVSGQWLVCKNREVIEKHDAKVYSKAGPDAPPMSTPHLDTRYINGKKELMFGPFAGFNTKFLKEGSYTDLIKSIKLDNISSMLGAFWHNLPLTEYLISQVSKDHEDRMNDLREFVKDAKSEDWELKVAGQRVQIIKKDEKKGGSLEFGTDIVHNQEGSITALLGASPGASTAVHIMIDIIQLAFPELLQQKDKAEKLSAMIPFWNRDLTQHQEEFKEIQQKCMEILQLND
ncbi:malate dehydrogenase (quinone) [Mesonia mobilis]|uniref:Probable malate:quinone oxidoreductase n=1 Tax=Mesonia mobilis TaxID=369791 RepID=A0ABQ3BXR2_9FLAO|nr:malate dehydrogenase (quinone) [Mesonia mobilis]MBQ0739409.1 malate dehydrogenase (quinone) [Aquimarina celericrescens]GGZ58042.1 putative malate:quinone oxidoreductase [Mesonia mobilis]